MKLATTFDEAHLATPPAPPLSLQPELMSLLARNLLRCPAVSFASVLKQEDDPQGPLRTRALALALLLSQVHFFLLIQETQQEVELQCQKIVT